jgi:hypothetical protein
MRKAAFLVGVFIGLALVLVTLLPAPADAEEIVCGQWRFAKSNLTWNTPVFVPCDRNEAWVLDPLSPLRFAENGYVRLYSPSVSDESVRCEGFAVSRWLWQAASSESISSCDACRAASLVPPPGYTLCAYEGQRCNFGGLKDVAYGANGAFYYKAGVSGGIDCNNGVLGDPIAGVGKACYIKETAAIPVNRPPEGYAFCANENQRCTFSGLKDVAYGAGDRYFFKTGVMSGIDCNNYLFGDPISGVAKACYIRDCANCSKPVAAPLTDAWKFISETVKDGTGFTPGTAFSKVWRLQNSGTSTWSADYALVFVSGNPLGFRGTTRLGKSVPPGQSIDVSIPLTAPSTLGRFTGAWKLSNAMKELFGPSLTTVVRVVPWFHPPVSGVGEGITTPIGSIKHAGPDSFALDYQWDEAGVDVYPVYGGRVVYSGCAWKDYGCTVVVRHWDDKVLDQKYYSVYAHLNEGSLPALWTLVDVNRPIGSMGKTGIGSNDIVHLHFALRGSDQVNDGVSALYGSGMKAVDTSSRFR